MNKKKPAWQKDEDPMILILIECPTADDEEKILTMKPCTALDYK